MNLKTTPFSASENKKKYEISKFNEMGISVNMLNEVTNYNKIPSGNFYKFGVIIDQQYFWYFDSTPVANDREKMLELFSGILSITKTKNQTPFVYKVKRV